MAQEPTELCPSGSRSDNYNTHNRKWNDAIVTHGFPGPQDLFCSVRIRQAIADAYANLFVDGHTLSMNYWSCAPGNSSSPGPRQGEVINDLVAMGNLKLLPKHIKDLADTFTKERVETGPPRSLASLACWSTTANTFLLDSGASVHAVGEGRIMQDIRFFSTDMWATLPDDSRLPIVGIGTIKMDGFSIPNVHLVDGLGKNLISVSQLDSDHGMCCSFHGGKCEIMLPDGTVVGGAILQDDSDHGMCCSFHSVLVLNCGSILLSATLHTIVRFSWS